MVFHNDLVSCTDFAEEVAGVVTSLLSSSSSDGVSNDDASEIILEAICGIRRNLDDDEDIGSKGGVA
jgi:hypothetical protein